MARIVLCGGGAVVKASLIILAQSHDTALINTLRCSLAQRYAPLEIIVVELRQKRGAAAQAFLSRMHHRIRYLDRSLKNVPQARNAGADAAEGEVLIYLDDHVSFEPDLVEQHMACYLDETLGAVQGRVLGGNAQSDCAPQRTRLGTCIGGLGWARSVETNLLMGQHFSVRRSLHTLVGGFDTRFSQAGTWSDIEFGIRCHHKMKIRFASHAVLLHHARPQTPVEKAIHQLSFIERQGEALCNALHLTRWQHHVQQWRRLWHDMKATHVLRHKACWHAALDVQSEMQAHYQPVPVTFKHA